MAKDIKELLARKLAENNQRHAAAQQETELNTGREHLRLPISAIELNPYQPRHLFHEEDIHTLASSIAEVGLLQPITVRKKGDKYQLIAGERRLRACQQLGRDSIQAIVTPAEDADMAILGLAENLQREDLTDFEIGCALRQIETAFPSKKKLAEALGLNREDMYRYYAFEALPTAIQQRLQQKPDLLARSAASDIKRVLQEQASHPEISRLLDEAWALLESGDLLQSQIAPYIVRRLNRVVATKAAPEKFKQGRKTVGTVSSDAKGVIIKLKANVLTVEQEQTLKRFLQDLLSSQNTA